MAFLTMETSPSRIGVRNGRYRRFPCVRSDSSRAGRRARSRLLRTRRTRNPCPRSVPVFSRRADPRAPRDVAAITSSRGVAVSALCTHAGDAGSSCSWPAEGSQLSQRGTYRLQSPSSVIDARSRTARRSWHVLDSRRRETHIGLEDCRRSAEFLSEPDEKAARPADVAEPIRVFVLNDVAADKLRSVLR